VVWAEPLPVDSWRQFVGTEPNGRFGEAADYGGVLETLSTRASKRNRVQRQNFACAPEPTIADFSFFLPRAVWRAGAPTEDSHVFISEAFAQAAPAAGAQSPFGGITGMLPFVLLFVVMYFVMIRPQMKRQKEHKAMIEAVAKGDEVVIAGGLLGKVSKLGETFIHVEIANGVEVQVQRSSIVQVLPKGTVK
jgi:preprotein translocase subunit YajC